MLQPVEKPKDIHIGETLSFLVQGKITPFEVVQIGEKIKIRSLDLQYVAHVTFDQWRKQRKIMERSRS